MNHAHGAFGPDDDAIADHHDRRAFLGRAAMAAGAAGAAWVAPAILSTDAAAAATTIPLLLGNIGAAPGTFVYDTWTNFTLVNQAIASPTDTYQNTTAVNQSIDITSFAFNSSAPAFGRLVTPFVARRSAANTFTVLAIGTTRTATAALNTFAFAASTPTVLLPPSEYLVIGFVCGDNTTTANPRSAIPFVNAAGADPLWVTGNNPGGTGTTVTVNAPPPPAFDTYPSTVPLHPTLTRNYQFQIGITVYP